MARFFKWLLIGTVGIVVCAGLLVAVVFKRGVHTGIEPGFDGYCEPFALEGSAEDIAIDHERGVAWLSMMDRKALVRGEDVTGTIMRLDLNQKPFALAAGLESAPQPFRPHGLSLYIDDDGRRHLFAINHPKQRDIEPERVELFREDEAGRLVHVETFTDPLFSSPNDLAAVGPRQFYIANDKTSGGTLASVLQQIGIGGSPLTWFDGTRARVVSNDIASGGGINVSADGGTLYVAETSGQRIRVLRRDPATGAVSDVRRIDVPMSPDNIDVAPDASLSVAGHADTIMLIRHFVSGEPAPSSVVRVIPDNGGQPPAVDQVYYDDGKQMSASSVGAVHGKRLLIGSITDPKLMVCEAY